MGVNRTFDEIFEELHNLYQGEWVEVEIIKDGLTISNITTNVRDLRIQPLEDQTLQRRLGFGRKDKLGSIVIHGSHTPDGAALDSINIPFKLGFNTMTAYTVRHNVSIESCGFEFHLRKIPGCELRTS